MLFNSFIFIHVFLPVTLVGYYILGQGLKRSGWAKVWLIAASLLYYGWWNPPYLILLGSSMLGNYFLSFLLHPESRSDRLRRAWLILGVGLNLAAIGYFKYANFFVDNLNHWLEAGVTLEKIILPLAISFFTFQQIAFLVDSYRGLTEEKSFANYCLFVCFFPQLIAGPIVHHKEMMPQFAQEETFRLKLPNLAWGVAFFCLGFFKKVFIADGVAGTVTAVFGAAGTGIELTIWEAWVGILSYTFQIYFDFSGYSDMAIGLGLMFGIKLPLNFNSPYKALNIVDFWRRWHITLSRFLRDYLYIPLGGNRKGPRRRYINLILTMLLGGLWHGAAWTFIIWGGLHGLYLVINHAWTHVKGQIRLWSKMPPLGEKVFSHLLTFLAVILGWVMFRAESLQEAMFLLGSMVGTNGVCVPEFLGNYLGSLKETLESTGFFSFQALFPQGLFGMKLVPALGVLFLWCVFLPNIPKFTHYNPGRLLEKNTDPYSSDYFRNRAIIAIAAGVGFFLAYKKLFAGAPSEFLYYTF